MHISGLFSTPWYRRLATRHVVTSRRFREFFVLFAIFDEKFWFFSHVIIDRCFWFFPNEGKMMLIFPQKISTGTIPKKVKKITAKLMISFLLNNDHENWISTITGPPGNFHSKRNLKILTAIFWGPLRLPAYFVLNPAVPYWIYFSTFRG